MYNITLISTFHSVFGKCTPDELYKIISSINPEVIFEELPLALSERIYKEEHNPHEPLELACVKKFLNRNVVHVPVDIETNQYLANQMVYVYSMFSMHSDYKELEDEQKKYTEQYGFTFLNSERCSELFDKRKTVEQSLLVSLGLSSVFPIRHVYNQFNKELNNRENAMVSNIYNYCKSNPFNQAVFLIGSAHRNSIVQKITEYNNVSDFKLNWTFHRTSF